MFQPKGRERETWVTLVQLTITSMFGVVIFVPGCQLFFNSIRLFNSSRIKSADFHFQSTLRIFCTNDTYTKKKQLLGANLFFFNCLVRFILLALISFCFYSLCDCFVLWIVFFAAVVFFFFQLNRTRRLSFSYHNKSISFAWDIFKLSLYVQSQAVNRLWTARWCRMLYVLCLRRHGHVCLKLYK